MERESSSKPGGPFEQPDETAVAESTAVKPQAEPSVDETALRAAVDSMVQSAIAAKAIGATDDHLNQLGPRITKSLVENTYLQLGILLDTGSAYPDSPEVWDRTRALIQYDKEEPSASRLKARRSRRSRPLRSRYRLPRDYSSSEISDGSDAETDPASTDEQAQPRFKNEVKRLKAIKDSYRDNEMELYEDNRAFNRAYGIPAGRKKNPIEYLTIFAKSRELITTRIIIYSEPLIDLLESKIPQRTGYALQRRKDGTMSIDEPFPQLLHYRHLLTEYLDFLEELEDDRHQHLQLLLDLLREECAESWQCVDEIESGSCKDIAFNQLWLLYLPGTLVFSRKRGEWEAFRVEKIHGLNMGQQGFRTSCVLDLAAAKFDHTGKKLRPSYRRITVVPYVGKRLIDDLELIPYKFLSDGPGIEKELYERGSIYWGFRDTSHFLDYRGQAWPTQDTKEPVRVIVDYATSSKRYSKRDRAPLNFLDDESYHGSSADEYARPRIPRSPVVSDQGDTEDLKLRAEPEKKPDDWFLLCPSRVDAFSLRNKDWRSVNIRDLRPVTFAQDSFKKLVIEKRYKAVVTAMVRSYLDEVGSFRDIVKGKGRGLVVLLHGAPGTGKTLTAECVAESEKRPLYMITSGDLGTWASDLQLNLRRAFENAVNWDAVLLLDEADVFLQERDVRALDRNALVSVFLRELEYFNGVMFLTTNRPGLIDEAFHSRIHITLHLPDLSSDSRMRIWAIFVKDLDVDMETKRTLVRDIESELRDLNLNGRQIRNCMRAAIALARQEKAELSIKQLKDIVNIGKHFTDYMTEMNRMNQNERAATLGIRLPRSDSDRFM